MKIKFVLIILCSCFIANAQSSIGATSIIGRSRFLCIFKSDEFDVKYKAGNAFGFSGFYETKTDSFGVLKFEITYLHQELSFDCERSVTHTDLRKNHRVYNNQLFKANTLFSINIANKPAFNLRYLVGPFIKYNFKTSATGNGSSYDLIPYTDSSSVLQFYQEFHSWEINDRKSKEISPLSIGIETGVEFIKPLSMKWNLVSQIRYSYDLPKKPRIAYVNRMSVMAITFNLGLSYKLIK